ncbi:MAG: DNA methyltransferase [Methermicoccaceae archaeon]
MYAEKIPNSFDDMKVNAEWAFSEYKPSETGKWTHGYHRYPAKFIPQLVEKLIDEYTLPVDAHINDPFYGCGTTIVTAVSRGFRASGTDVNRVAHLITKVKSTPIEPSYLGVKVGEFISKLKLLEKKQTTLVGDKIEPLLPVNNIERVNYWFTDDNKIKLGRILRLISHEEDKKVHDFLLVAFSHILKNCSLWAQGSTKPTRDINKVPVSPYVVMERHLRKMQRGNDEFYRVVPKKLRDNIDDYLNIEVGDARAQPVKDESVDMIITSSPYVTSYEYADLHQLSTIWLDFVVDLKSYKREFIGTTYKKYDKKELKSEIALEIVDNLHKKDKNMAENVKAFFIDMQEVFNESFRILKHGGRCCYVIGNTRLKGVDILNAEVFAESLSISGFNVDRVIKREIPLKILPQKRDERTGRFAKNDTANSEAYPVEYIIIGLKE